MVGRWTYPEENGGHSFIFRSQSIPSWWFRLCFMFTLKFGKMIQFDVRIFFRWADQAPYFSDAFASVFYTTPFGKIQIWRKRHCFWLWGGTVDGRNPAPPGMVKNHVNNGILIILGGFWILSINSMCKLPPCCMKNHQNPSIWVNDAVTVIGISPTQQYTNAMFDGVFQLLPLYPYISRG